MPRRKTELCLATNSKGNRCRYSVTEDGDKYCKGHTYLNDYTDEMLENLHKCNFKDIK